MSFQALGLSPELVSALASKGFETPFEVQVNTIPLVLDGTNVCCRAPTGSGKTLAFALPALDRLSQSIPHRPKGLILTPTRELAEQIFEVMKPLARDMGLWVGAIYGGVSYGKQRSMLEKGVDVVIACPGRLQDLMDQGAISLKDVEYFVLDEADRMVDMGFVEPVKDILTACKAQPQIVLFSATLDDEVAGLIDEFITDPITVEVGHSDVNVTDMVHLAWTMPNAAKVPVSETIIRRMGRSVVFCRTRASVERVVTDIRESGVDVLALHGGLTQSQRSRAMESFSNGETMALIATDVAARGLDVDDVRCVIHFDPPDGEKSYKHRSGRTARGGAQGVVISLIQNPQKRHIARIFKESGLNIDFTPPNIEELPEAEVRFISASRPSKQRHQRHGGRPGRQHQQRKGMASQSKHHRKSDARTSNRDRHSPQPSSPPFSNVDGRPGQKPFRSRANATKQQRPSKGGRSFSKGGGRPSMNSRQKSSSGKAGSGRNQKQKRR